MKKAWRVWVWIAVLVLGLVLVPADGTDAQTGWGYSRQITIQSSQVAADLTDFPVLLSLSGAWLRDMAHGGHVAQPDGGDIMFMDTGASKLDHEIEQYDGDNGTLVAWVRIPSLSGSTNTPIDMYYGNPTCPDQWNPTGVWDAHYTMVHHLHEPLGPHEDSTAYGNDGTPLGGVNQNVPGQIDGADGFDGVSTRVDCGTGSQGWRDQRWGQQRAVIKDGKVYMVGGGDDDPATFEAYIFVFDLATGALLQQSPSLGTFDFTASETAPVVDGDMVYACPTFGNVFAWRMSDNSIRWATSGLSIWSNRLEYDGQYLYATTTDYNVVKIDVANGNVLYTYPLPDPDSGDANAVPPYLDAANGVVFAMGAQKLHKLSAADLSPLWATPPDIGTACLDAGMSSHSRMAPIVVDHPSMSNGPWVIFGCYGNDVFYAYDYAGNQQWSSSIPEGVRAVASYNPNNGRLYIPSQGDRIYILDVLTGTEVYSITGSDVPSGSGFGGPATILHNDTADYLVFKTTGGNPRYIYVFDANANSPQLVTRYSLGSDLFLTCFPIAASEGYLVTGGSLINYGTGDLQGGIFAAKAGGGQAVDYYPLYGPYRYGYIENALTDLVPSSLNPTGEITLEAWATVTETTTLSNDHLICRDTTYCLKFAQESAGDAPRFQLYGGGWQNLDHGSALSTEQWHYLVGTWDGSDMRLYIDGGETDSRGFSGTIDSTSNPTFIGSYNGVANQAPLGIIDEVRLSDIARSAEWILTSYNNQNSPSTFYNVGSERPTAIRLLSFTATPGNGTVTLVWETATEIDNLGFNLYRSEALDGDYVPLNQTLIPSQVPPGSPTGATYTWVDEDVSSGLTYYYELEDIDVYGNSTRHGPVSAIAVPLRADGGWGHQRTITIDSAHVEADLTDFPVLLSLSGDWLKDTVHGGQVAQSDGGDILFTMPDYSNLDHEIEAYNGTDGTLVAWVRIPFLSGSSDTEIYMLHGNQDVSNQSNATGVWDANYVMVQHMQEISGTHFDSTSYTNHGTPMNGVIQDAVGILDGADDFDGDDDYVDCGTGEKRWSNQDWGQQRAVIKGGKVYVAGGGVRPEPFSAYIFVFDLETGALLQQSPAMSDTLDFTASETAPVVDGDMVFAVPTKGNVHAWDMLSNTFVWTTTQVSTWSSRMEYDGSHLYATTTDYKVVKIDASNGAVVDSFNLDPDIDYENAVSPYLDEANDVVYAMGGSNLYKLSASDLSEIWSRPIGTGCLDTGSGHSRMTPILVNDANTGGEPWLIAGCWGDDNFYAHDEGGTLEWTIPITEGVRSPASYNPNSGYLYIPSQGDKIYVRNISDGSGVFAIDGADVPAGTQFDKPMTIVHSDARDYLIFKTTGGTPRYIYVYDANSGAYVTRFALGSDTFLTCFPIAVSQGYLVTGGSIVNYNGQDGGIYAVKAGAGDPVDYYPLHGPYRYGYIENALTDLESNSLILRDGVTLEAWANLEQLTTGSNDHLVCREEGYCLKFAQENAQDSPRFQLYDSAGGWHLLDLPSPLNADEWYYLVGTWVSPTMEFYVNGMLTGTLPFTGTIDSTGNPTLIGAYGLGYSNQAPDGRIDEVRISNIARSGAWIRTSHNNQSAPLVFSTVGPDQQPGVSMAKVQEGPPVTAGSDITFTIVVTNSGDLDLSGLAVVDPATPDCDRSLGSLAVGAHVNYSCGATGVMFEFTNTAMVSGTVSARMYVSGTDSASVDLLPSILVTKTADPANLIEPGGTVTFSLTVDNTCSEPLTLTSLIDSIHGDLSGQGSCLVPQALAPDAVYGCTFTATVAGSGGYQEVDEVMAWVNDDEGNAVAGSDTATVTLTADLGILVEPTVLTVTEPTSSDIFVLSLISEPTAAVTVPLTVTSQECTVTLTSVVLDDSNWQQGVQVTVAAVDDPVDDGAQICEVWTHAVDSADPDYDGIDPEDVMVTVLDDDEAAILVGPTGLEVGEPDGSALFTVTLQTQPTAVVSIALSASNDECMVSTMAGSEVVLDATNWNLGVGVIVTALDDEEDDDDQTCVVHTDPAESTDGKYDGIDPDNVTVIVHDDDVPLRVYLPVVLRGWPPVPTLGPLPGSDCDGQYTVSWGAVPAADTYALQEATDCTFADPVQVYKGSGTSHMVTGQAVGTYCYRVRALGPGWASSWSNSQPVDVLDIPDAPALEPIDNADGSGNYAVSWSAVDVARTYVLTEARGDACREPAAVYTGPATSYGITGLGAGRFCYYVQARNDCGHSEWSSSRWVDVLWEAEPNNTGADANGPLAYGLTYFGTLPAGDLHDYFYIDLLGDRGLDLWLTHIPAGHDYDLYLRNEQESILLRSNQYGNADEHIVAGILPPGKYYVQVHHYSPGGSTQPYHLEVATP